MNGHTGVAKESTSLLHQVCARELVAMAGFLRHGCSEMLSDCDLTLPQMEMGLARLIVVEKPVM